MRRCSIILNIIQGSALIKGNSNQKKLLLVNKKVEKRNLPVLVISLNALHPIGAAIILLEDCC